MLLKHSHSKIDYTEREKEKESERMNEFENMMLAWNIRLSCAMV